jgi:hypothetical protein
VLAKTENTRPGLQRFFAGPVDSPFGDPVARAANK